MAVDPQHPDAPQDPPEDQCPHCEGYGTIGSGPDEDGCLDCGGVGVVPREQGRPLMTLDLGGDPLEPMTRPDPVTREEVEAAQAFVPPTAEDVPAWIQYQREVATAADAVTVRYINLHGNEVGPQPPPPPKLTTLDLIDAASALARMLNSIDPGDEVDLADELEKRIFQWMERVEDKVHGLYHVIKRFKAEAKLLQAEEGRLTKKRQRLQKQAKKLEDLTKDLLVSNRQVTGEGYVATETFTARLHKNPPRLHLIKGYDGVLGSNAQDEYFDAQPPKLNKDRVRKALKAGKTVPGAKLVQDEHVRFE